MQFQFLSTVPQLCNNFLLNLKMIKKIYLFIIYIYKPRKLLINIKKYKAIICLLILFSIIS